MDLIDKIIEFFKKPKSETENSSPEGTCNLCWGRQEYDGKIREILYDKQVDVNNHKGSYMRIQKFIKDNIDGYHLKDGILHVCPNCTELEEGKDRITKFELED